MFELTVQREKVWTNSVTLMLNFMWGHFTGWQAINKFCCPLLSIIDDYSTKGEQLGEETTSMELARINSTLGYNVLFGGTRPGESCPRSHHKSTRF